jgi:hypothetical protein
MSSNESSSREYALDAELGERYYRGDRELEEQLIEETIAISIDGLTRDDARPCALPTPRRPGASAQPFRLMTTCASAPRI